MFKNYFKITLRTCKQHPGYTIINIAGLALGLGCFFLIVAFIQHELSYDSFHAKADRITRLIRSSSADNAEGVWYANSAAGYAPILQGAIPEIESVVRVENFRSPYVRLESEELRRLEGLMLADPSFFEVFDFPLLQGDRTSVLDDKYSIVLSKSTATTLFGQENPLGKTIRYGDGPVLTVVGVMNDVPAASYLQFNAVASFQLLEEFMGPDELQGFTNYNYDTFVLLRDGADREEAAEKITQIVRTRFDTNNTSDAQPSQYKAGLQPLGDIHLTTDLQFDRGIHRDAGYLYVFGAIGILILMIACINFMNLATARATQRATEVGVRKAVGAERKQLVWQFLGESIFMSMLAMIIGFALATLLLPMFNEAVGSSSRLSIFQIDSIVLIVFGGLAAGILAGSYPAFYLSAFRPAHVLKGNLSRKSGSHRLKQSLIVFQFTASIFLTVAALIVYRQLGYMQDRDLGFTNDQVMFVSPPQELLNNYDAFKQELMANASIQNVALLSGLPGRVNTNRGYNWPGQIVAGEEQGSSFWSIFADPDYLDVLDIELLAGRSFSHEIAADVNDTYILNETAIRQLGWSLEEAVGQPFRAWDRPMGQIIGVVKDFHFQSLHEGVEAVVINFKPAWMGTIAVRTHAGSIQSAVSRLQDTWAQFASGYPLNYRFLDEDFDRLYQNEARLGMLFTFFASMAVFIACLGLFGLAAHVAQQRTKEIGIRKVLGASPRSLVFLLSKDFMWLMLTSLMIALPAVAFVMSRWLESFAYRTNFGITVFLIGGLISIAIALFTVSGHTIRAASLDPVKSLRYE